MRLKQPTRATHSYDDLGHLANQIITPGTAADRDNLLKELVLLRQREWEIEHPEENVYQRSFTRFRTELCWTRDEERGGRVALIPDYPYLREVDYHLMTKTPLMTAKARRMLMSWTAIALDLWITGGGQDPRWVDHQGNAVLMNGTENRKVIIGARKLEDENGSADFLSRARFMYEQFEARGGREKWPAFPTIKWGYAQAKASNGSILSAVPQGKDQLAGSGATLVHLEEFSRWSEQKASLASALQTTQAGGHLLLVATAQTGTHAARIALDQIERTAFRIAEE